MKKESEGLMQINYDREGKIDNVVLIVPSQECLAADVGFFLLETETSNRTQIFNWVVDEESQQKELSLKKRILKKKKPIAPEKSVDPKDPEIDLYSLNQAEILVYGLTRGYSEKDIENMMLGVGSAPGNIGSRVSTLMHCVNALEGKFGKRISKTVSAAKYFLEGNEEGMKNISRTASGNIIRVYNAMVRFKMDKNIAYINK